MASWSSRVSNISSPWPHVAASARDTASVSDVMFGPKAISPGCPPSRSAIAACADSLSASVSREVRKAPPALAVPLSRCATIRAMAGAQTWVPPGASKYTRLPGWWSALNCARTVSIGNPMFGA
ncbi:MAG: hypothetical protein WDN24_02110 [Sphingomonas sp.]